MRKRKRYNKRLAEIEGICSKISKRNLIEAITNFVGLSVEEDTEAAYQTREERAWQHLDWIFSHSKIRREFKKYLLSKALYHCGFTYATRLAPLTIVILNYLTQRQLFDREVIHHWNPLKNSEIVRIDPMFSVFADELVGDDRVPSVHIEQQVSQHRELKIADFGSAPKRDGAPTITFMHDAFQNILPHRPIQFHCYDIFYRDKYPRFSLDGKFLGWQRTYRFNKKGIAVFDGITYFDAARNPAFNIVPQRIGNHYCNTYDSTHAQYDIITCSMLYSVYEILGCPPEVLECILQNLLNSLSKNGVLFLHICDDCFKIFLSGQKIPLFSVIPFLVSPRVIHEKVRGLIEGNIYTQGLQATDDYTWTPEQTQRVAYNLQRAIYQAHRQATSKMTFSNRLFEAYSCVDEGASYDMICTLLSSPTVQISDERQMANLQRVIRAKKRRVTYERRSFQE